VGAVPAHLDLTPYAGRWVAIVRGRVAGVGLSAEEARRMAKHNRPKEEATVIFVPSNSRAEGPASPRGDEDRASPPAPMDRDP